MYASSGLHSQTLALLASIVASFSHAFPFLAKMSIVPAKLPNPATKTNFAPGENLIVFRGPVEIVWIGLARISYKVVLAGIYPYTTPNSASEPQETS